MAIAANGQSTYFPIPQNGYNAAITIVLAAQAAWAQMVAQFAAENLAMGITPATMGIVGAALQQVNTYGSQGALWLAYDALSQVQVTPQMAPFLTAARIQWMRNQFVGIISTLP